MSWTAVRPHPPTPSLNSGEGGLSSPARPAGGREGWGGRVDDAARPIPDSVDCTVVSTQAADQTTLNGYQLRLPTFEGPLDVLLRLIERSQLVITDVSLVAVTEQFLAHVDALGGAPAETIADFAAVAARLVLLKSRSLLPRPPVADEEPAPDDLVRELVAYRHYKEIAQQLATWDARGLGAFPRGDGCVEVPRDAAPVRLAPVQPIALAWAIRRRLTVVERPPEIAALRPMISLREMIERVLTHLAGPRFIDFGVFTRRARDRHEVLTAFLAVLVLVRRRIIEAEQAELFGDITLRPLTTETQDGGAIAAADD